jgi:hypothetical protein
MVLARRCGPDSVSTHVASLPGQAFDTVRRRLRASDQEARARRGPDRQDFQADPCFAPLPAWVLSSWPDPRLALALDVPDLGSRSHVLCVSALYGGIGIPVARKILVGNQPDARHPHWGDLLARLRGAAGPGWRVAVLSDRGLGSPRRGTAITAPGWHPLLRAKRGGTCRPEGRHGGYGMGDLVRRAGQRSAMAGSAYRGGPLRRTLLACRGAGHDGPRWPLTDLPPRAANPCW